MAKRSQTTVVGTAYWRAILVATKEAPQMVTATTALEIALIFIFGFLRGHADNRGSGTEFMPGILSRDQNSERPTLHAFAHVINVFGNHPLSDL
jgi:hypothetical protein